MAHTRNKQRKSAGTPEVPDKHAVEPTETPKSTGSLGAKTSRSFQVIFTTLYALLPITAILTYFIAPLNSYVVGALAVMAIPIILALDPRLANWRVRNSLSFTFIL